MTLILCRRACLLCVRPAGIRQYCWSFSSGSERVPSWHRGGLLARRRAVVTLSFSSVTDPRTAPVRFPRAEDSSVDPITMVAGCMTLQAFDRAAVSRFNPQRELARSRLARCLCSRVRQNPCASRFSSARSTAAYCFVNTCTGMLSTSMTRTESTRWLKGSRESTKTRPARRGDRSIEHENISNRCSTRQRGAVQCHSRHCG